MLSYNYDSEPMQLESTDSTHEQEILDLLALFDITDEEVDTTSDDLDIPFDDWFNILSDFEFPELDFASFDELFMPTEERHEANRNLRAHDGSRNHKKHGKEHGNKNKNKHGNKHGKKHDKKHDKKHGKKHGKKHDKKNDVDHKKNHNRHHVEVEQSDQKAETHNIYKPKTLEFYEPVASAQSSFSPNHSYDVDQAAEDMIFIMLIIMILDITIITIFIRRLRSFRKCLEIQKTSGNKKSKKTQKKTKAKKKGKKPSKKVEEEKLTVEHVSDIEANVVNNGDSQQDFNDSIDSIETDAGMVKTHEPIQAPLVPSQSMPREMPREMPIQMPVANPQIVMIDGREYVAVKASDLQNMQRVQPQMMYSNHRQYQI